MMPSWLAQTIALTGGTVYPVSGENRRTPLSLIRDGARSRPS